MRRSGKTTRLIDKAIQTLFESGMIFIPTWYSMNQYKRGKRAIKIPTFIDVDAHYANFAQENFSNRLLKRLEYEHTDTYTLNGDQSGIIIKAK